MNELRVISHISPDIENKIICNIDIDGLYNYFNGIHELFSNFKTKCIFVIPNGYDYIFKSSLKLRIFKEIISSDTQSNVIFEDLEGICHSHKKSFVLENYDWCSLSKKFISFMLNKRRSPSFFGLEEYKLKKIICNNECANDCSVEWTGNVRKVPTIIEFDSIIAEIIRSYFHLLNSPFKFIPEEQIKSISFFCGVLYGLDDSFLENISSFIISEECLNDIRDLGQDIMEDISFTMLRAISFPSSKSPERVDFSIDWHINKPHKINGYDFNLFRVDVLPYNRSGLSGSGANRLLIAMNSTRKIFIGFTNQHDFTAPFIKKRLEAYEKILTERI